ncbi:YgjP family zinc-dependent metalloprotease [Acinetobacter haemolyticus]|uniref:M48 family metallopeptidase n=1 Tax=Acinetobacter haemolyticus TaxID=29430 RepID=A0AAW4J157_ACIHA|nr:SprT family zinc-dependent metalloprotease [Acinetobacter haemolyticus]MBO3656596.1 M48 family metallopeptidase [Acinetobacter haemolyticus]MCU4386959.1 M48 family metallopeptidase [Acinetobacter haemolyticus]
MVSVSVETPLPEVKVVRHARARNLRLRVEPTGIRLTVPLFCTKRQIQQFLNQSEPWLLATWAKQQQQLLQTSTFPEQLVLFAHTQSFSIVKQKQRHIFIFNWELQTLFIREIESEKALQAAVLAYAKQFLPEYLNQISREIGLPYQACTVRKPKTRWGSCTSKHDIMLNAALVLMPESIVRSVCVHELAHTKHFDHSEAFWAEVAKHDRNYIEHRKQLKQVQLPSWYYQK